MPLIETKGAASAQGFGEFAASSAGAVNYIEDVFSTYLYTGNDSTNAIVNGIDLSTKGGLVWIKNRTLGSTNNTLTDTARGVSSQLATNVTTQAQNYGAFSAFNTNGFTVYTTDTYLNASSSQYASWTFRKQPKFFDVVTWTGNDVNGRLIPHSLGSVPGCVIIKCTSNSGGWVTWHRSIGANGMLFLNDTAAADPNYSYLFPQQPTATDISVYGISLVNQTGRTYVAYLFAHDAGGFGLTGTDNVISCGSFTTNGSGLASVTLGYEPQWLLLKSSSAVEPWNITDTMRGWTQSGTNDIRYLQPNTSGAEGGASNNWEPNATGFSVIGGLSSSTTYVYVSIRRGPMKVPTSGTSVFSPNAVSTDASAVTTNFPVDLSFESPRSGSSNIFAQDRLRGANKILYTYSTDAESTAAGSASNFQSNTSVQPSIYGSGTSLIFWNFQRAPSFFDEVCYTGGGGAGSTKSHNLGVAPEFMIVKRRNAADNWAVYHSALTASNVVQLNTNLAATAYSGYWNNTAPTASVFTTGAVSDVNSSGSTYVAYLFATCAGVSKVGSYTGTGATQTISCGFTGGARFVLVKRTDSTGDWYVWDTARGMVSGTDPSLKLNTTAAEVNANSIYTTTGGFQIVSTVAGINASGGTYIFLAIA